MRQLLKGYISRGGISIVISGVSVKLISLMVLALLARYLDKMEYGNLTYAVLVVSLLSPVVAGGFSRAFLRYGALCKTEEDVSELYDSLHRYGLLASVALSIVFFLSASWISQGWPDAVIFLRILCWLFVAEYLLQMLNSYFRIRQMTRRFAIVNFSRAVCLALITLMLIFFISGKGYALAMVLAPLIVFVLQRGYSIGGFLKVGQSVVLKDPGFWSFLRFVSISAPLNSGSLLIGGIVVGAMLENAVLLAQYRVASLIPMTLLLLPKMFFTSEFVHITKNHESRSFVINYLKQYSFLMLSVSTVAILVSQLLGHQIITLIFGEKYSDSAHLFQIMTIGLCGALLLRQPFGVLLNSSGRAGLNMVNTLISTVLSLVLLAYLISLYGVVGAAYGVAISFWLSGLIGLAMYFLIVFPKLNTT